jgi:hypothetical protein
MTAEQARTDLGVRDHIAAESHASERAVVDFLRGYPPGRGRLAASLRAVAIAAGVDLATLPVLSADEIAEHRESRRGKCARCAELSARVAELEARLAVSDPLVTSKAPPAPAQATERPPKPTLVASAG